MSKEKKLSKNELDKWLITAMSHMKTMYEDNGIPWSDEHEATFQQVRCQCLESSAQEPPATDWLCECGKRPGDDVHTKWRWDALVPWDHNSIIDGNGLWCT